MTLETPGTLVRVFEELKIINVAEIHLERERVPLSRGVALLGVKVPGPSHPTSNFCEAELDLLGYSALTTLLGPF